MVSYTSTLAQTYLCLTAQFFITCRERMSTKPDWLEDRQPSRSCSLPAIRQSARVAHKPRLSLAPDTTFNFPPIGGDGFIGQDVATQADSFPGTDRSTMTSQMLMSEISIQTDAPKLESKDTMTLASIGESRATMTSAKSYRSRATMTSTAPQNDKNTMTSTVGYCNRHTMTSPANNLRRNYPDLSTWPSTVQAKNTRRLRLYWQFVPTAVNDSGKINSTVYD